MADINVRMGNAPSTAGLSDLSRGAVAPKAQEYAVDKSAAMKIQGKALDVEMGATLFDSGMKGADNLIKQDINQTTTAEMDQIYSEFGVDSMSLEGRPAGDFVPPKEVVVAEDNLKRLTQAYDRGTINENSYWARVESVSRQLRARYPGHRDYIDQRISSVSGGKPANEMLRNMMQEGAKRQAAANSGLKQRDELAQSLAKQGILPSDWEKMDHHQLINASVIPLKEKAQLEHDLSAIQLAKTRNEATGELTTTAARTLVSSYVSDAYTSLTNGMPEYPEFIKSMTEAAKASKGGTLDDATIQSVRTSFNQFRTKFVSTLTADLNEKFQGQLTDKQMEDAMSPAMRFLNTYETALVNKDYGQLAELANRREAMKNGDSVKLLSAFPVLRANAAVNANLGEIASNTYLEYSSQLMSAKDKALFSEQITRLWSDPNYSVSRALSDNNAKGMGKEANSATVMAIIDTLNNPDVKIEGTIQAAKMLYGEGNASMLNNIKDPGQRLVAYSRMINPTIFNRVKQLKDQGYTQIYDDYIGWATFNFSNIARSEASDLVRSINMSETNINKIGFDEANGQFFVKADPNARGQEAGTYYQLNKKIAPINTALKGIIPIIKDSGQAPREFVQQVFSGLGLDTNLIQSAPSKLGGPKDTPQLVSGPTPVPKRLKPGQGGQVSPEQGDTAQMNELSTFITQKRQDLTLYNQMINEDPNNADAIDAYEKTLLQVGDAVKELNSLSQQWLEEFSRKATKLKPTINK